MKWKVSNDNIWANCCHQCYKQTLEVIGIVSYCEYRLLYLYLRQTFLDYATMAYWSHCFYDTVHRRCIGNVQFRRVSIKASEWQHNWHTHALRCRIPAELMSRNWSLNSCWSLLLIIAILVIILVAGAATTTTAYYSYRLNNCINVCSNWYLNELISRFVI